MNIVEKVKALNLPAEQFVVMGSAILELKGIRKAEDIDIIVTRELFEQLKNSSQWHYKRAMGDVGGGVDVEMLEQGDITLYPYIYGGGTIDFFLNDPNRTEEIHGIKFASLQNLLEVKSSSWDRPKDRQDAELIKAYLASK
jgi:hypothetical protein